MLQSLERSSGAAAIPRSTRTCPAWRLTLAGICLTLVMMSAIAGQAAGNHKHNAQYWKGRNISEATKKLGEPTQMTPLSDTGGTLYIFAHHGEQHWVFETDPGGKIIKAAKVE